MLENIGVARDSRSRTFVAVKFSALVDGGRSWHSFLSRGFRGHKAGASRCVLVSTASIRARPCTYSKSGYTLLVLV